MNSFLALFFLLSFNVTHFDSYKTESRWALVEVGKTKLTYWQALPPRNEQSVFDIEESAARDAEIEKRVRAFDESAGNSEGCPLGMVRVHGEMQDPNATVAAQNKACNDPNWDFHFLCTKFDSEKLKAKSASLTAMDYCIDRFEFPNIPNEFPGVLLSYTDGEQICSAESKHLCTEDEWTFACEGPEAQPYPYGYNRYVDPTSVFPSHIVQGEGCNIDVIRHGRHFDPKRMLRDKKSPDAMFEIDNLWAGTKSGSRRACVSPFGVYDITGNVEEWVHRTRDKHASVLKGGYWSPVESRCQPGNAAHGPGHTYYQTGFRCCSGTR